MKNGKLKAENYIKQYVSPVVEVVEFTASDIITSSPGTETPWYEENDGIWEMSLNP